MGRVSARSRRGGAMLWVCLFVLAFAAAAATIGIVGKPKGLVQELGARYVLVDLTSGRYEVTPVVASGAGGEDFAPMMQRLKPLAAITGTFYDGDYRPQGDIVARGRVVSRGHHRQGMGFTRSGDVKFLTRKVNHRIDWRGYWSGIASGPKLVSKGKVDLDMRRDGFSSAALEVAAARCAVGVARDGRLILCVVTQPITLKTMGALMVELGARDAINMDGGGSCALYQDGACVVIPHRPVSNVLAVFPRNAERAGR